MHAGNTVPAEKVNELLLTDGLYLTRLDGFGGHFMRNIGEHCTQPHEIARPGYLENHRFAVARRRRDLHLAKTDDEDVAGWVSLRKQLCSARMAHHDADAIVVFQCFGGKITEHPQVTVLAIETVF